MRKNADIKILENEKDQLEINSISICSFSMGSCVIVPLDVMSDLF